MVSSAPPVTSETDMSKSQTAKTATTSTTTTGTQQSKAKRANMKPAAMDVRTVPLDSLALDPGNVRKTGVSDRATAELAASIASIGLITPLGCFETSDAGQTDAGKTGFSVVAGGRRLAALKQLAADGTLPASLAAGIPIVVFRTRDELTEISLAENIVRADMSAADQIEAWGRLHDDGLAAAAIAARFGVAEALVHQRLKLSKVAGPIIEALRAEEIDLGVVRAFTLCDDVEAQHTLFTRLKEEGRLFEAAVRDALTDDKTSMGSRLARFIGLDAYREAGGTVTRDLFDDGAEGIILNDPSILNDLVEARLAAMVTEIEATGGNGSRCRTAAGRTRISTAGCARPGVSPPRRRPRGCRKSTARCGRWMTVMHLSPSGPRSTPPLMPAGHGLRTSLPSPA